MLPFVATMLPFVATMLPLMEAKLPLMEARLTSCGVAAAADAASRTDVAYWPAPAEALCGTDARRGTTGNQGVLRAQSQHRRAWEGAKSTVVRRFRCAKSHRRATLSLCKVNRRATLSLCKVNSRATLSLCK
eukprot:1996293-Rhodomonas_salina.1